MKPEISEAALRMANQLGAVDRTAWHPCLFHREIAVGRGGACLSEEMARFDMLPCAPFDGMDYDCDDEIVDVQGVYWSNRGYWSVTLDWYQENDEHSLEGTARRLQELVEFYREEGWVPIGEWHVIVHAPEMQQAGHDQTD